MACAGACGRHVRAVSIFIKPYFTVANGANWANRSDSRTRTNYIYIDGILYAFGYRTCRLNERHLRNVAADNKPTVMLYRYLQYRPLNNHFTLTMHALIYWSLYSLPTYGTSANRAASSASVSVRDCVHACTVHHHSPIHHSLTRRESI